MRDDTAVGRLRIDDDGVITDCNARIATIIRTTADDLIGRHVLQVTAHADRDRCIEIFNRIRDDGVPVTTVKRIIRADRSHAWVTIDVRTPEWPRSRDVAMAIRQRAAPRDWVEPAILHRLAGSMLRGRRARNAAFGTEMFADHGWDLLLAAYVAEAEGRALTIADLQAETGVAPGLVARWIRVLHADRLTEFEERDGVSSPTSPIRLTGEAHDRFERFLSDIHRDNLHPAVKATIRPGARRDSE